MRLEEPLFHYPPLHVSVVGYSGSGKTSLLEHVVPRLTAAGCTVGYLKGHAHRVDLDREGKDTERLRRAGASAVGVHSREGAVYFPPTGSTSGPDARDHDTRVMLWNVRPLFDGCDLVLIEGLKAAGLPKILVNRGDNPRGELPASSLRGLLREVRLPRFPDSWEAIAEEITQGLRGLLDAPARVHARDAVGAVLAGGASRRMGEDKARLSLRDGDGTWCERAFLLAAERCIHPWVVGRITGPLGLDLPHLRRPACSHLDLRTGGGVLGGMETALRLAGGAPVLVVPCDLPLLDPAALDLLLANRDPAFGAVVFRHRDGRAEPAIALLEPAILPELSCFLDASRRRAAEFFEGIRARWLEIPPELEPGFANLNSPEDLRRYVDRAGD